MARRLEDNGIVVNYQALPDDETFLISSGIRTGVSEMTRFGMDEDDFGPVASMIARCLRDNADVSAEVEAMDAAALRDLADAVKGKLSSGILLLDIDDRAIALADSLEADTATVDLDAALDRAQEQRPELTQLRKAARIAELGVRIARTANLPNAFVQANASYKNPVGFSAEWGPDWNATAGVSWPIFNGGANLAKLKAARSRQRQAQVALAQVEDAAFKAAEVLGVEARQVPEIQRGFDCSSKGMQVRRIPRTGDRAGKGVAGRLVGIEGVAFREDAHAHLIEGGSLQRAQRLPGGPPPQARR